MTIRRDLSLLAEENLVDLIPGGAILKRPEDIEDRYLVTNEESVRTIEKLKIGQRAVSLIQPNETIILDIGTTTEYLAKYLFEHAPITILCYTLNTLGEVYQEKNCSIIFAGGYFHHRDHDVRERGGYRPDQADPCRQGVRLGSRDSQGARGHDGVSPRASDQEGHPRALQGARILVVDSSKFGQTKSVYFADMPDFQTVITDFTGVPEEYARTIRDLGIELIVVRSIHVVAAVDVDGLAGDVGRLVGGEKEHEARHVLGRAQAADGDLLGRALPLRLVPVAHQVGHDGVGRHRVAGDAVGAEVAGHRAGERHDGALGRPVDEHRRPVAVLAGDRRHLTIRP